MVLPQGFKNSPTLFGKQLARDLQSWESHPEEGKLLQYVDNLLRTTQMKEEYVAWMVILLNFLDRSGIQGIKEKGPDSEEKGNLSGL